MIIDHKGTCPKNTAMPDVNALIPQFFKTACFVVALCFPTGNVTAAETKRPNILWLVAEDFGTALSCYGNKDIQTPVLDQLAKEGVRYSHFYTTAPVCSPSRSAFMTGMYAVSIGAHNHRTANKQPLSEGVRLLSQRMHDAGYFTANLAKLPASFGFKGTGKTDWNFTFTGEAFDGKNWVELKEHQPFFAQLNFHETHRDFLGPKKVDPARVTLPPYYPDHPVVREDYARYLDDTLELDRKVGVILEQLKTDGLLENTIIVFMGDNGEAHVRAKQFCYEEGLHVPLIIRWAASMVPPAHFKPGTVDDRLLESIDLAPTYLDLVGVPIPASMQGRPFLGNKVGEPKQYVFGARDRCDTTAMCLRTVRDERYRYIKNFTPEIPFFAPNNYKETQYPAWNLIKELHREGKLNPVQAELAAPQMPVEALYDMQQDPHEIKNLATSKDPVIQETLARMRGVLEKWIVDINDQGRIGGSPAAAGTPAK
jgi:N-sulfoglucosamine sulfohydrolase